MRFGFSRSYTRSVCTQRCDRTSLTDLAAASNCSRALAALGSMTSSNSRCRSYSASLCPENRIGPQPYCSGRRPGGLEATPSASFWDGSPAPVLDLQGHEAGDRRGEVELTDYRLQVRQASSEWIRRYDVAVTGRGQRGKAEIHHGGDFAGAAGWAGEVGECARAQLPDQA